MRTGLKVRSLKCTLQEKNTNLKTSHPENLADTIPPKEKLGRTSYLIHGSNCKVGTIDLLYINGEVKGHWKSTEVKILNRTSLEVMLG